MLNREMDISAFYEEPRVNQTSEVKLQKELPGSTNLCAKAEMAKELYAAGLSGRAIGRILHVSDKIVAAMLKKHTKTVRCRQ